jgi:serine/threonine protein kinase
MAPLQKTKGRKTAAQRRRSIKHSTAIYRYAPGPHPLRTPPTSISPPPVATRAPRPPPQLFRTVRLLAGYPYRATWLCLPRKLRDSSVGKALHRRIGHLEASSLQRHDVKLLPQLVVVKTNKHPSILRHELAVLDQLEEIHERDVGKNITGLVGSVVVDSMFSGEAESSFLAFRPLFGCTLRQFNARCRESGELYPPWLFWHVVLGVSDALEYVQSKGVLHRDISMDNIMFDPYPFRGHRFRDYPNVVLIDFEKSKTTSIAAAYPPAGPENVSAKQDVRALVEICQQIAGEVTQDGWVTEDGERSFGPFPLELNEGWYAKAVAAREEGPPLLPVPLARMLHNDLATVDGLRDAVGGARKVELSRFGRKHEEFRAWAKERSAAAKLVLRFSSKLNAFRRLVEL